MVSLNKNFPPEIRPSGPFFRGGQGKDFSIGDFGENETFKVPTVEKRLIASFLLKYDLTQLLTKKQFIHAFLGQLIS